MRIFVEESGREFTSATEIRDRIRALDDEYADRGFPQRARDEWNALNYVLEEFEKRSERLRELARDDRNVIGVNFTRCATRAEVDLGLRTIHRFEDELPSDAADRLDDLVRERDTPDGIGSRYLNAVADPNYATAFAKLVRDPIQGHVRFTPEEGRAFQKVELLQTERAMGVGSGAIGGFAVPFQLDPSIMISGAGAINPLRQISRVETTVAGERRGVSADQVSAFYSAEGTETTDSSPTLVQPTVKAQRGTAFVPFSIEIEQDYDTLMANLGRVLADARDVLDAPKMITGTGTNEPGGILNIGGSGGLTTSQRVQTATTASYALADGWSLKQGIPARFQPSAQYVANPAIWDVTYRFVGGNSTEPPQMPSRDGPFLGRPKLRVQRPGLHHHHHRVEDPDRRRLQERVPDRGPARLQPRIGPLRPLWEQEPGGSNPPVPIHPSKSAAAGAAA